MEKRGPDSLEGWIIAFICCLISTLLYGISGLSGMLFVASVVRYNTEREQASFPYILSTVLQAVSGPFVGYFAKRFGSRIVILVGSIFGFLGIGTCFFAEDIMTVTVLWGVVFGIGFGLSSLLLPVVINEYFFKQRSVALGMSYLGSPIGFFIFPPIFEALLNEYGLSGAFLILSGIFMHCIPLSMLVKRPNFKAERENSPLKRSERHDSYLSTTLTVANLTQGPKNKKEAKTNGEIDHAVRRHSIEFLWRQSGSKEQITDKKYVLSLNKGCSFVNESTEIQRSFRKTNRNIYENSDKKVNERLDNVLRKHHGVQKYDKNTSTETTLSKNYENLSYIKIDNNSNCQKYGTSFLKASAESHIKDEKRHLSYNLKIHPYEEISTIYFSTDYNSFVPLDYTSQVQKESGHNNELKKTQNVLRFSSPMKYDSVLNSAYSMKIPTLLNYKKVEDVFQPENGVKQITSASDPSSTNVAQSRSLLFDMYLNPVFILICIINAIVNLHYTTVVTIIIDFSRDQNVSMEYEKYIMMGISFAGAFGMMGLGWVTDSGYMAKTNFGALTQFINSICTVILPFTVTFETLMVALLISCICESSFIPLLPAITADYFDEDIQAVAISACNVLSGPLYLIIPPLIGYFRDVRGSYNSIFFLLSGLVFLECIIIGIIPYIVRWQLKKRIK